MNVVPVLAAQRCLVLTHTVVEQIVSGMSCSALVVHLEASNFDMRCNEVRGNLDQDAGI